MLFGTDRFVIRSDIFRKDIFIMRTGWYFLRLALIPVLLCKPVRQ